MYVLMKELTITRTWCHPVGKSWVVLLRRCQRIQQTMNVQLSSRHCGEQRCYAQNLDHLDVCGDVVTERLREGSSIVPLEDIAIPVTPWSRFLQTIMFRWICPSPFQEADCKFDLACRLTDRWNLIRRVNVYLKITCQV